MDFSSAQSIKSSTVSTEYMPEEDCLFMEKDGLSAVFYQVESGDVYCQGNLFQEYNNDVIPYGVEQMLRDLVVYTDEEERYKAFETMYDLMTGDAMPEIRYVF